MGGRRAAGKCMRRCSAGAREVAVMEVTQVVGVRTRARALALAAAAATSEAAHGDAGRKRGRVEGGEFRTSYLQLRSRSLILTPARTRMGASTAMATAAVLDSSPTSRSSGAVPVESSGGGGGESDRASGCSSNTADALAADVTPASEMSSSRSGLPSPEVDDGSETTACNYGGDVQRWRQQTTSSEEREREPDDLESTARPTESGVTRRRDAGLATARSESRMPTEAEIEEFFAAAEKREQKRFADKYNYDVVKDIPLEGRYDWVQMKP